MQKQRTVPAKTIFTVYLVMFVALGVTVPITDWLEAFVIGLGLSISLAAALLAAALTLTAPLWVLTVLGLAGLISVGIGAYVWITVPEGILDPLFIVIGGGVLLAEIVLAGNRYWRGRRQRVRS